MLDCQAGGLGAALRPPVGPGQSPGGGPGGEAPGSFSILESIWAVKLVSQEVFFIIFLSLSEAKLIKHDVKFKFLDIFGHYLEVTSNVQCNA